MGVKRMKSVTVRRTAVFWFWMILFLLQNGIQQKLDVFQYADELFALLVIPLFLLRLAQNRIDLRWTGKRSVFLLLFLIFLLSGWCGFLRYHYQPFLNAVKDSYVNLKFFMAIGTAYLLFEGETDEGQTKKYIWPLLNGLVVFLFVFCLADLCFGIYSTETRGGLRAVKLFYSAYTFLVGNCVLLSSVCLWFYREKRSRIILPLALLAFTMLSTRRVKAMGAVACVLMIYLLVLYRRQRISKKIKILACGVVAAAAAAGIYQIVSYYYLMGVESARAVLTVAAPFIAADHFPFGTGWGTYGSAFSTVPYSPVYGMYRMSGVWGISPDYPNFVSDTFWPMVLAQCGVFGFLALIGILIMMIREIFLWKQEKSVFASALLPVLYLLISSTSESAFANPIAVPLAFWIGFLFSEQRNRAVSRKAENRVGDEQ